jgi:hypothetical protein
MQIHVRSVQMPRWFVPALILLAVALLPFALMLGLALAAAAVAVSILRVLLPSAGKPEIDSSDFRSPRPDGKISDSSAIDAEYEVKDPDEKK